MMHDTMGMMVGTRHDGHDGWNGPDYGIGLASLRSSFYPREALDLLCVTIMGPASAETLPEALVRTYQGNPQLNAERARLRGTDESVPQALSGTYEGAKVALAAAEAEVRAASIALAGVQKEAAAGRRTTLGLNTPDYAPEVHYHQVRDAWHGLRTPGGQ
jgi:hypothetical protein